MGWVRLTGFWLCDCWLIDDSERFEWSRRDSDSRLPSVGEPSICCTSLVIVTSKPPTSSLALSSLLLVRVRVRLGLGLGLGLGLRLGLGLG